MREKADYITVSFKITSDKSLEAGERTRIDNISREKSTEKQEVPNGTPFLAACCEDDDKVASTYHSDIQVK